LARAVDPWGGAGRCADRGHDDGDHLDGGVEAPASPIPFGAPFDFLRDEVVEICGALALGGSLLRRLGLSLEAARLEALFAAVQRRLAEPPPARAVRGVQSAVPASLSGS
jgi:hypothetical protein